MYEDKSTDKFLLGLRYIPELSASTSIADGQEVDILFALNGYRSAPINSLDDADDNKDIDIYRAWLRFSSPQSEIRTGLQKINFGPARILRSLQWFDHIDPQDPLNLTDGVSAILFRRYFLDNSNIWLWGINGDDELKGLELYKTDEGKNELGGRYQFNVPKGELGLSYNRRQVEASHYDSLNTDTLKDGEENRFAIDGSFDVVIGLWFEASVEKLNVESGSEVWRNLLTLGADYTISSGVYFLYEHFIQSTGSNVDVTQESNELSALSLSYDFGIIDTVKGICYYDSKSGKDFYYIDWQRTYDNWIINLSGYENSQSSGDRYGETGIRCMLTFNH